jgi:hypothetical protein
MSWCIDAELTLMPAADHLVMLVDAERILLAVLMDRLMQWL